MYTTWLTHFRESGNFRTEACEANIGKCCCGVCFAASRTRRECDRNIRATGRAILPNRVGGLRAVFRSAPAMWRWAYETARVTAYAPLVKQNIAMVHPGRPCWIQGRTAGGDRRSFRRRRRGWRGWEAARRGVRSKEDIVRRHAARAPSSRHLSPVFLYAVGRTQ